MYVSGCEATPRVGAGLLGVSNDVLGKKQGTEVQFVRYACDEYEVSKTGSVDTSNRKVMPCSGLLSTGA